MGSEAIFRFENGGDGLSAAGVLQLIQQVRQGTTRLVTTAEPWHVYRDHPELAAAVDLIFINVHPYWEQQPIENAVDYVVG